MVWKETNIEAVASQFGGNQTNVPERQKRRMRTLFIEGATVPQLMERFGVMKRTVNWVLKQPDKRTKGEVGKCPTCGAFVYLPCVECTTLQYPPIPSLSPSEDCDVELHGPELQRYLVLKAKKDAEVEAKTHKEDDEHTKRERRLLDIEMEHDDNLNKRPNVALFK
jgi:hypothetical protein